MSDAPPAPGADPPSRGPEAEPQSGDSLLDAIAKKSGRSLKVTLRDAGSGEEPPIIDPKASAFQEELSRAARGKYRVLGEIARGGMGVVLRGHDLELGRDVAMKVVHADLANRPEVIERFVEEAQVGGQLQHPGIVPVYEIGLMADQRPYFTMKLIKGRTLAAMLSRRKAVDEDRLRFLTIFEAVCQTMAYAHSKGVIHRDLKPANIMVGAFGEVQVVDWGLSKVLHKGGVADELEAQRSALTVIETVRSGPRAGAESMIGNVLGTPAYMSPEQARGEIQKLDERSDVFALGAILCEIVTGAPPYVAREGENLLQKAALAELDDARARIDAASAPAELKKLCLACLLPTRQARPSRAEELATAVHEHIAGLESAAHMAQLAAAEERLRAERSRRRQHSTLLVGAALFLAGAGWWWVDSQRRARLVELERGFDEVRAQVASEERDGSLDRALEAAKGGQRMVEAGDADQLLLDEAAALVAATQARWDEERARQDASAREATLLDFLTDVQIRQASTGITETDEDVAVEYRRAFHDYGIELTDPELGPRLVALRDTELGIRLALGFDGWARVLRRLPNASEADVDLLTGVGLDLDTDIARTTVRQALVERDVRQLGALAHDPALERAAPATLFLLASALAELGERQSARRVLTLGVDLHPGDFSLAFGAAVAYDDPDDAHAAMSYLRAAVALRPDLPRPYSLLCDAQNNTGDSAAAIRSLETALALAPEHGWNTMVLAQNLMMMGRFEEARPWYDRMAASGDGVADVFAKAMRVYAGELSFEDFVTHCGELERSQGADSWILPAVMLTFAPPPGVEPDPQRALELLDRPGTPGHNEVGWLLLGTARLLVGDAPGALEAVERTARDTSPGDRFTQVQIALVRAGSQRLAGNDAAADEHLRVARWLYAWLVAGREAEWERSLLHRFWACCEPLAAGR